MTSSYQVFWTVLFLVPFGIIIPILSGINRNLGRIWMELRKGRKERGL